MTREPIEVTRQDRIYCLKASSDYHSELCEECKFYPNCDHMTQDDMTELTIKDLETLEQESKTGHCKDCKYFEYDSVAKVDGIPLIVAHEICSRWGDGCKTKEDGYCFLFEPQESENCN